MKIASGVMPLESVKVYKVISPPRRFWLLFYLPITRLFDEIQSEGKNLWIAEGESFLKVGVHDKIALGIRKLEGVKFT